MVDGAGKVQLRRFKRNRYMRKCWSPHVLDRPRLRFVDFVESNQALARIESDISS